MKRTLFFPFVWGLVVLLGVLNAHAKDTRTPVRLNEIEHEFVLAEMRGFVESVQQVLSGVVEGDMKSVAEAAMRSGKATSNTSPRTLGSKFPSEFAALGSETHYLWDLLAAEATDMGDAHEILDQLSRLMNNCTACHASYRLVKETP